MQRWFKKLRGGRPQLPKTMTQTEAKSLLEANGWKCTIGGKHNVKMEKQGFRPVTLPKHHGNSYSPGFTKEILKQAGLL